jgi:hypothetical protein
MFFWSRLLPVELYSTVTYVPYQKKNTAAAQMVCAWYVGIAQHAVCRLKLTGLLRVPGGRKEWKKGGRV